jgi:hypothetical protein
MTTVSNTPELDDELAAITDQLLAGKGTKAQSVSPENEALAQVVSRLYNTIGPASGSMSTSSRTRLTQKLNEEWAASARKKSQSRSNVIQMGSPRTMRMLSVAAVTGIVLFFVFIVLGGQGSNGPIVGSAVGAMGGQIAVPLVIVGVLALAGVGYWWFRRR